MSCPVWKTFVFGLLIGGCLLLAIVAGGLSVVIVANRGDLLASFCFMVFCAGFSISCGLLAASAHVELTEEKAERRNQFREAIMKGKVTP